MEGLFIRWLWTRKFRTHNPFYLSIMIIFGVLSCLTFIPGPFFVAAADWRSLVIWVSLFPLWLTGLALLINAALSFSSPQPPDSLARGNSFF